MKTKPLYHGSPRKLKKLLPKKALGLSKKEDKLKAVYATDIKDFAITMTLISCKGVSGKSSVNLSNKKVKGIISKGWPKQKYIYLYFLDSKEFNNTPKGSHQHISTKSIKPQKEERLLIKDYINLISKK